MLHYTAERTRPYGRAVPQLYISLDWIGYYYPFI